MSHSLKALLIGFITRRRRWSISIGPRPFPELVQLTRAFNSKAVPAEILLLGDSVTERISKFDTDRRNLGEMLVGKFSNQYRAVCISHSAYHMEMYYTLLRAIKTMRQSPKLVILPINMRSFSPQWDWEPSWQFDKEIKLIDEYLASPNKSIPKLRKFSPSAIDYEKFDASVVAFPLTSLNTIGQFRLIVNGKPRTKEQFQFRKRQIFIFHYLHNLSIRHKKVNFLLQIAKELHEQNISLLLYITPLNYQAGIKYVGTQFLTLLNRNRETIRLVLASYLHTYARLLDLSDSLGAEFFFQRDDATEHLNQFGRMALVSKLFEVGNEIMESKKVI